MPSAKAIIIAAIVAMVIIVVAAIVVGGRGPAPSPTPRPDPPAPPCPADKRGCTTCAGNGRICDSKFHACLGGFGGTDNGQVRHLTEPSGPDASWHLIPAPNGNYYICDEQDKCLVAGMASDDGNVYHQPLAIGQPQGRWKLVNIASKDGDAAGSTYNICNEQWGRCIAGGLASVDGSVYLQDASSGGHARWTLPQCKLQVAK